MLTFYMLPINNKRMTKAIRDPENTSTLGEMKNF